MKKKFFVWKALLMTVLAAAGITVVGFAVMFLWNTVLIAAVPANPVTFWQALGIFALCKILFGFGRGHGGPFAWKRRMKNRMREMSPEEREKFKEEMCRRASSWWSRENCEPFSFNKKTDSFNKNPSGESNDH